MCEKERDLDGRLVPKYSSESIQQLNAEDQASLTLFAGVRSMSPATVRGMSPVMSVPTLRQAALRRVGWRTFCRVLVSEPLHVDMGGCPKLEGVGCPQQVQEPQCRE